MAMGIGVSRDWSISWVLVEEKSTTGSFVHLW
jgi:hypothetical protein